MKLDDNVDIVISRLEEDHWRIWFYYSPCVAEQSHSRVGSELHQSEHFQTFTAVLIETIWLWIGKPQMFAKKAICFKSTAAQITIH